jgi:hypothetical protein
VLILFGCILFWEIKTNIDKFADENGCICSVSYDETMCR